jgi:very-short-patch-repair endonuclease
MSSVGEITFALHCKCYGLFPEPEYRFAEKRKWRFDYAWPDKKIAAEIEGGTWINGRHNRGSSIEADLSKYNEAALLGWRVFRFSTDQVKSGVAIQTMLLALGR